MPMYYSDIARQVKESAIYDFWAKKVTTKLYF